MEEKSNLSCFSDSENEQAATNKRRRYLNKYISENYINNSDSEVENIPPAPPIPTKILFTPSIKTGKVTKMNSTPPKPNECNGCLRNTSNTFF